MIAIQIFIPCAFWTWAGWPVISAIGTLIAAIATAIYTYFTYQILDKTAETMLKNNTLIDKNNKVAEFNTYLEIKRSLDNDIAVKLVKLCANNVLNIDTENENIKDSYTIDEVRQHLLDPIEDIATYHDDDLISLEKINYAYGYTILYVGNNENIVKLINIIRSNYKYDDMYSGFEKLYKAILSTCSETEKANFRNDFKISTFST